MRDVIGVGAVNCEEFWGICSQLGIGSFPTLILFTPGTGCPEEVEGEGRERERERERVITELKTISDECR